jgi:uncharacterized protein YggE
MRKNWMLLALGAVAALLLTACQGDTTVNSQPADTTGIAVSGHGEVQAPPDIGFLDVGVQVTAPNVADARDRAAKAADAVISALKKDGVDEKDIKTTGFSIQPQYDYRNGNEPRITGYMVTNTVEAKVRKLDTFNKAIDDAIAAGGNDVRLQGIRFGIDDNSKIQQQAREKAMADAKAKAEQLAKLAGVDLGKPMTISETQTSGPDPRFAFSDASAKSAQPVGAPSTPIQAGTTTVVVDVAVRWSLK